MYVSYIFGHVQKGGNLRASKRELAEVPRRDASSCTESTEKAKACTLNTTSQLQVLKGLCKIFVHF